MRMLHAISNAIPVWPFDRIPENGPMLVEIYTGIAARGAGLSGPTKLRSADALDTALHALGSKAHAALTDYDDHRTDAILGAAWLRNAAGDRDLWRPGELTDDIRRREGWTFGVA